jgi:hypothetical protein
MRILINPLGRRLGDADLVRVGKGEMVHVKHPLLPGTLCMPNDDEKELRKRPTILHRVQGEVVTCYRCLKLMAVNQSLRGDPLDVGGVGGLLEEAYSQHQTRRGKRG